MWPPRHAAPAPRRPRATRPVALSALTHSLLHVHTARATATRAGSADVSSETRRAEPFTIRTVVLYCPYIDSDTVTVYNCPMNTNAQPLFTIDELAARADVPIRTVRFYIAEGLLPGASTRGKGASYTQEHLDRLQLIRLLAARHLPLAEIHALVTQLPPGEVHAV